MAVLQKKKSGENAFHFLKIHIEDHMRLGFHAHTKNGKLNLGQVAIKPPYYLTLLKACKENASAM